MTKLGSKEVAHCVMCLPQKPKDLSLGLSAHTQEGVGEGALALALQRKRQKDP